MSETYYCRGETNDGSGCQRRVAVPDGRCQHHPKSIVPEVEIECTTPQCRAETKFGEPCQQTVGVSGLRCNRHMGEAAIEQSGNQIEN